MQHYYCLLLTVKVISQGVLRKMSAVFNRQNSIPAFSKNMVPANENPTFNLNGKLAEGREGRWNLFH